MERPRQKQKVNRRGPAFATEPLACAARDRFNECSMISRASAKSFGSPEFPASTRALSRTARGRLSSRAPSGAKKTSRPRRRESER